MEGNQKGCKLMKGKNLWVNLVGKVILISSVLKIEILNHVLPEDLAAQLRRKLKKKSFNGKMIAIIGFSFYRI